MNAQTPITEQVIFNPADVVDRLGVLKAQIAKLEAEEKALTEALKAGGLTSYAGQFFDCTVSTSERSNFDVKRLRADLGDDVCKDYVLPPTKVVTLKLTAKK